MIPEVELQAALGDRYRIEQKLGAGGMATVFLAYDIKHERRVALKVLHPDLAHAVGAERFVNEIRLMANLLHPHILSLFDSGSAGSFLYYTMPYVEGETVRERLDQEKQLPIETALDITGQVAKALHHAHTLGIVHRDIKPENILLSGENALVADFGIARAMSVAGGEHLTQTGVSLGTPAYMSPEQAAGEGDLDGRSDIYALGCVLFEMLIGEPPFTGPTARVIIARHATEPVPSLQSVRSSVPDQAEAAVKRALEKTPADRFSTAEDFASALRVDTPRPVTTSKPRWTRWTAAAAVVIVGAFTFVTSRNLNSGLLTDETVNEGYYRVSRVINDTVAVIDGGTLAGIQPGARVSFYSMRAEPGDDPVLEASITYVDELSADVRLPNPGDAAQIRNTQAFVHEYRFGTDTVRVALEGPFAGLSTLADSLNTLSDVEVTDEAPNLVVAADEPGGAVHLRLAGDRTSVAGPFNLSKQAEASALVEGVRSYLRSRFFRQIELRDPAINVHLELVPATHRYDRRGGCVNSDTTQFGAEARSDGWVFHPGDGYLLRLHNRGGSPAFVTILSLREHGTVQQLFPHEASTMADTVLPGESYDIDLCYTAEEPYGEEVIKLFATRERVDFRHVLSVPTGTRGGESPDFASVLSANTPLGMARSGVSGRARGTGSTHDVTIRVVPVQAGRTTR